ncbi:MAG: hypothetical protein WC785_00385 [Tatlockia sp.]|jgi:hypothetical protein
MSKLILHPTEMSQWHALVNEAQAATNLILTENTESYLVFLLMRFAQGSKLIESVVALDFLQCMQNKRRQVELLRDVGDKSLLFCGLFPGMAKKRHVSLDYFVDMGQSAYLTVGELNTSQAGLFVQLSEQFLTMQQILRAMQHDFLHTSAINDIIFPRNSPLQ